MDIDKKLTEKYHFEVCEKHPNLVWANISRWSSECPLCELESDWDYQYKELEKEKDELDGELETANERVSELEDALAEAQDKVNEIVYTLKGL